MIGNILKRELRAYWRNRQFKIVLCILIALCGAAAIDGWNRADQANQARQAAQASDRHDWVHQGKNNPHSSAHFARYAFRPTPALAAFEPGVFDYAGAAVWMEAHHQNPSTLRRAEDSLARAPVPILSAGWVVRVVGSLVLVVLLFRSIAQERESKTLRAIAALGVRAQNFVMGKMSAALVACLGLSLTAMVVALLPGLWISSEPVELGRAALIVAVTLMGLSAFGLAVLSISASSPSSGTAMIRGGALWLVWAIGLPMMAAQMATTLHPDLDEQTFKATLQEESQNAFWSGGQKEPAVAAFEAKVLKARGAKSLEEINFNKKGVMLQAHEEFANQVFDREFGALYATHRSQDRVLALASVFSPLLALQRVTAAIAGTDLMAQHRFSTQAEVHRRAMVAQLNKDLMEKGGGKGMKYMADRDLWEAIPDFQGELPSLSDSLRRYSIELGSLLFWLFFGSWAALRAAKSAMRTEVVS